MTSCTNCKTLEEAIERARDNGITIHCCTLRGNEFRIVSDSCHSPVCDSAGLRRVAPVLEVGERVRASGTVGHAFKPFQGGGPPSRAVFGRSFSTLSCTFGRHVPGNAEILQEHATLRDSARTSASQKNDTSWYPEPCTTRPSRSRKSSGKAHAALHSA